MSLFPWPFFHTFFNFLNFFFYICCFRHWFVCFVYLLKIDFTISHKFSYYKLSISYEQLLLNLVSSSRCISINLLLLELLFLFSAHNVKKTGITILPSFIIKSNSDPMIDSHSGFDSNFLLSRYSLTKSLFLVFKNAN